MPLHLHRAPRADLLADALGDLLATPLTDPFATELVIVPARGVERWLSQRLSHRLGTSGSGPGDRTTGGSGGSRSGNGSAGGTRAGDGVCAGVEFRSPHSLVAEITGSGEDDPWTAQALVWPLLGVIDASAGETWCSTLDQHLGATGAPDNEQSDLRRGRRWSVAHRLSRLFMTYAVQRPTVLTAWEGGRLGSDTDGTGRPVPSDLAWQPELWRRLVAAVGVPSPGVRHTAVVKALRADPGSAALPQRFSLFGHTRIPATEADLLAALAEHRGVDLWLPHPSDALWRALDGVGTSVPRDEDDSHTRVHHPLLATLGRDVRELQRTLAPAAGGSTLVPGPQTTPTTLLHALQHGLISNAVPAQPISLRRSDRSVQVHACHGTARQVEVLREVVLGLLADDATLEPRDILVMCPDIETFAPLIEASFGLGGLGQTSNTWHPGQQLEVRLADRSLVQTNPLLAVVGRLLDLAGGRAPASAVLDLAAVDPVRRRFGFSDDDLDTIGTWVEQAGVRWAFDAEHRAAYGLADYVQNTWRFGLDRLLTGVAVSDDADTWFGATLPLDDVGSTSIDLAGRLAELVSRLEDVTDRLTGSHPVEHWLEALRDGLLGLTSVPRGEEWQAGQAQRELAALGVDATAVGSTTLRLPDVRALMAERLTGRPTRANFRTGSLTVCTMVPMRSVPHRVVCLLGLDDGVFPRSAASDGDDLLARRPLTGERDLRSEDRQLMLDAVMAATDRLVVTYSGANETTGATRPPAVPLGELLDALDVTAEHGRTHALVRHPLQRFDRRYLLGGDLDALGGPEPFSFDVAALAGARVARDRPPQAQTQGPVPLLPGPLPAYPAADVDLADLDRFLRHPVKEFFRSRLGVAVADDGEDTLDGMPVELDALAQWSVGDRLLRDQLRGRTARDALGLEWRRGVLPPGRLGWALAQEINGKATPVAALAEQSIGGAPPRSLDVDVDLGDGRRLRGTVTDLFGNRVVKVSYSRLGPRHYLDAWLPLLALHATWPGGEWSAGAVGRGGRQQPAVRLAFGRVQEPERLLRSLVRLYDAGMREPIPLPLKTSHAYASARTPAGARAVARQAWEADRYSPESLDPLHVRAWGGAVSLAELVAAPPLPGEDVTGQDSRFGALAHHLWHPVLKAVHAP